MKSRKVEQGSAHVIIVVVLVVALLGALGFIFWQNFVQNTSTNKTDTSTSATKDAADKQTNTYSLDEAVVGINKTLSSEGCHGKFTPESLSSNTFKKVSDSDSYEYQGGVNLINIDLTYANVQYGCGTSGEVGLLKRTDSDWKLVYGDGNLYPLCSLVRGQGFPRSIIEQCVADYIGADPEAI